MSTLRSDRGTRRADLQRRQRKKPRPLWLQQTLRYGLRGVIPALLIGAGLWSVQSGWASEKAAHLQAFFYEKTAAAGLSSTYIFVTGRTQTSIDAVHEMVAAPPHSPLLAFDPAQAKERLQTLPWVHEASVQRRFPNTIMVTLTEREPIGFLQQDNKLALVDSTGTILTRDNLGRWAGLPVLIGEQAPQKAAEVMHLLNMHPEIYRRVTSMTFINQRRWNIRLDERLDILLPENDIADALRRLENAQQEGDLIDKDTTSVDLRLPDRLIVNSSAGATARRSAPKQGI